VFALSQAFQIITLLYNNRSVLAQLPEGNIHHVITFRIDENFTFRIRKDENFTFHIRNDENFAFRIRTPLRMQNAKCESMRTSIFSRVTI